MTKFSLLFSKKFTKISISQNWKRKSPKLYWDPTGREEKRDQQNGSHHLGLGLGQPIAQAFLGLTVSAATWSSVVDCVIAAMIIWTFEIWLEDGWPNNG